MTHMGESSNVVIGSDEVLTRLWTLDRRRARRRKPSRSVSGISDPDTGAAQAHGVFDEQDLATMKIAYLEACAFFGPDLKPRQKEEIALSILSQARRGVRDPHRLALKAIVAA